MAPPKSNSYWTRRGSHGRKLTYADADKLWAAATEYFEWVEANPLMEEELVSFQGVSTREPVAKMRAMTIAGLCLHLGIGKDAWHAYRERDGFKETVETIDAIIRQQKFEGAAADLLNAAIIARDLGLAEKSVVSADVRTADDDGPRGRTKRAIAVMEILKRGGTGDPITWVRAHFEYVSRALVAAIETGNSEVEEEVVAGIRLLVGIVKTRKLPEGQKGKFEWQKQRERASLAIR